MSEEMRRELTNLQGQLGSMILSIDDNLPPAFVPLFLKRLGSLVAKARFALSLLDGEVEGEFVDSFEATLENVRSELKGRERPN